jgi:hypothetical protein
VRRIFILSVMCLWAVLIRAQKLEYRISSMGLKVANLSMSIADNRLDIKASNSGMRTIFPHLNNSYSIHYEGDFLPLRYLRLVHQDSLKDSVLTTYGKGTATMLRKSSNERLSYPIPAASRDFFSLLWKICQSPKPVGNYIVDGNGRSWQATVSGGDIHNLNTSLGKFQTTKYQVKFKALSQQQAPYVDMLTHNTLSEDITLSIWVNQGGIPVKAHIRKKLMSMTWEILSIS